MTETKQRNLFRIVAGTLMLISGLVSIVLTSGEAIIGSFFLTAGLVFVITGIIRPRRHEDGIESDERSKKIGAYGLSYGWLTGIFFMFGLFWLDYLGILRMGTQLALALSIVVLALSTLIYQMYLSRRGDVD